MELWIQDREDTQKEQSRQHLAVCDAFPTVWDGSLGRDLCLARRGLKQRSVDQGYVGSIVYIWPA